MRFDAYRYGFNGKENDNEIKGEGNQQDYGMRVYDPRIGKFLSVDPLTPKYPELTPYQFASDKPIEGTDLDGLEHSPASARFMRDNTSVMLIPHPAEIEAVKQSQANAAMHRDPPVASLDVDYTHTIWGSKGGYAASDKMLHYEAALIPGATIGLKKLRVEEITKRDWVIEAVALIPIGKVSRLVGKGGELLLKGAGEFVGSPCVLFAADFMKKIAPTLIKEGAVVKRFEIILAIMDL